MAGHNPFDGVHRLLNIVAGTLGSGASQHVDRLLNFGEIRGRH
jgi:hypothetical protein